MTVFKRSKSQIDAVKYAKIVMLKLRQLKQYGFSTFFLCKG